MSLRSAHCSQPITVYIDSPGGSIESYEHLEGLLFNANQDGQKCRIITVVTSFAASAAARLLAKGDYSMAYKNATIHCHGSRYEGGIVTKERAESMAESLALFNEEMSNDFAHKIIESLTWLYRFNADYLEKTYSEPPAAFRPIAALSELIRSKLIRPIDGLLDGSLKELQRIGDLESFLQAPERAKLLLDAKALGHGHEDLGLLRLIIDYLEQELSEDDKFQGLPKSKISELISLFSLRRSYYERFIQDCDDPEPLLMMFCSKEQLADVEKTEDLEKRRNSLYEQCGMHLFTAWQLATTVSSNLVKGENSLSATDAYWLGLVEEVVGDVSLDSRRRFHELTIPAPPTEPLLLP